MRILHSLFIAHPLRLCVSLCLLCFAMRPVARVLPQRRYSTSHKTVEAPERVRCFALPLLPRKWAFYPDKHSVHSVDPFGGGKHSFTGKIGALLDRARNEWEECAHAPPGTMRNRVFQTTIKLQSRIDPREILCRALAPTMQPMQEKHITPVWNTTLFLHVLQFSSSL